MSSNLRSKGAMQDSCQQQGCRPCSALGPGAILAPDVHIGLKLYCTYAPDDISIHACYSTATAARL
jgi:hypothetical protein